LILNKCPSSDKPHKNETKPSNGKAFRYAETQQPPAQNCKTVK
jgi:hypothetical protein